jgi:hypothetical protein
LKDRDAALLPRAHSTILGPPPAFDDARVTPVPTTSGSRERQLPRLARCAVALGFSAAVGLSWAPVDALSAHVQAPPQVPANGDAWLEAVRTHRPGVADAPLLRIARWDVQELHAIVADVLPRMTVRQHQQAMLLHTELAIAEKQAAAAPSKDRPGVTVVVDGRAVGEVARTYHWGIGRRVAAHLRRMDGGAPIARDWLRAVGALQQEWLDHSALREHLGESVRLLPDDPWLLLLDATMRQEFAGGRVQAHLRESGGGWRLGVAGPNLELMFAESVLRRAVARDPTLVEARIRLAHVLTDRGKAADAAALAGAALEQPLPPFLEYYAALVLGRAEARLGRLDRATAAFERAGRVFPRAQAPRVGLSHLALRRGAAADGIATLSTLADPAAVDPDDDPWWLHRQYHEPRAEALLQAWVAGLS